MASIYDISLETYQALKGLGLSEPALADSILGFVEAGNRLDGTGPVLVTGRPAGSKEVASGVWYAEATELAGGKPIWAVAWLENEGVAYGYC